MSDRHSSWIVAVIVTVSLAISIPLTIWTFRNPKCNQAQALLHLDDVYTLERTPECQ